MNAMNTDVQMVMDRFTGALSSEELKVVKGHMLRTIQSKFTSTIKEEDAMKLIQELRCVDLLFKVIQDHSNKRFQESIREENLEGEY